MADQFITDITKLDKSTQDTLAANAKSRGMTAEEYLAERGGVNPVTKKYSDSYNATTDLNDAEYQAAIAGKSGIDAGKALNAAQDKKLKAYIAANPNSPEAIKYKKETRSQGSAASAAGLGGAENAGTNADGTVSSTSAALAADPEKQAERQSAYDLLYAQFKQYGLEALVEPLKGLITSATPPSEFIIKLRDTDAYKKRFAGNAARIQKGLAAISEAEYIGLEDQYQNIMRNYGLPASYWEKDSMGTQPGFTNFIGNDVSAPELEDRIMTAQKRVINSNPQVSEALKKFYPEITNGDILAYTLDPTKGLDVIKRKITAAEIGGAALAQGLETGMTRAEELAKYGVTKEQAMQGYQTAAEVLPRGGQLAAIYGESPYTQQTAEQEIFGLAGSTEAAKQRKKLVGLERASFSGQTGLTQGALGRERAGNL